MASLPNVTNWPLFNLVDPKLRNNIKKAYIYGQYGNQAMFITTEGDVYSFGQDKNAYGSLGLGNVHSTLQPMKIDVLCKKGIFCMAFGEHPHVVAASTQGEIYAWGYGGEYNIGDAAGSNRTSPVALVINLEGQKVSKVCCGGGHTVLLTSQGEVYCWGRGNSGQCGIGSSSYSARPVKITSGIGSKDIRDIVCGQNSTYALLDNGEVHSWGIGTAGQLGTGSNGTSNIPVHATSLRGIFIKQIVSGKNHVLVLSDAGKVYSFGSNESGQLGHGSTENTPTAREITGNIGEVTQVAAIHNCDLSAAMTRKGKVYVWGFCIFQAITSPTLVDVTTLDEVFANFAIPCVTWRPLSIMSDGEHDLSRDLVGSLRNGLDDSDTADTIFIVEDKRIYAHKAILMIRCDYFRKMFQSEWKESKQSEIHMKSFTYDSFRAFLEYLYTGDVNIKMDVAIDLLQLADCYQELHLKKKCEETLKRGIKVDNCAFLFSAASKHSASALKEFCSKFAANHMSAVMSSKAFQNINNADLLKDFLFSASKWGAFKY